METQEIEALAAAAHMVNRAYCIGIGDTSQPTWSEAPDWQRQSCIKGVDGVLGGNGPEANHESWLAEKVRTGWKYGPEKDPEKKEHPCMVPYSELPESQRKKDGLYVEVILELAKIMDGD